MPIMTSAARAAQATEQNLLRAIDEAGQRHAMGGIDADALKAAQEAAANTIRYGTFSDEGEALDLAVEVAIAAWNRRVPPVAGEVKALEWGDNIMGGSSIWTGELAFGAYYVAYDEGNGWRAFRKQFLSDFEEEVAYGDKASILAAVQAHYTAAIRSALEPVPAAPVQDVDTAEGGDYVPTLIRNEEGGFIEFVERDVPTMTGEMMAMNVEPIYDLTTRQVVGYRLYDDVLSLPLPRGKND